MREFVRHPSDIPVDIEVLSDTALHGAQMQDVSTGGLSCRVSSPLAEGTVVAFSVPSISSEFSGTGVVVWCRAYNGFCQLGIEFSCKKDAYQARMVEQVCHIEQYRNDVAANEGRHLSGEEAAEEWIERYAAEFDQSI